MKDISETSEKEKSIMLLKLKGCEPIPYHDNNASWYRLEPAGESGIYIFHPQDFSRINMFVGIYDGDERISRGDQPYDDDDLEKYWQVCPNLYDPANMALAKTVMEWAGENLMKGISIEKIYRYSYTFTFNSVGLALDGVLYLALEQKAIEAGKVQDEKPV